MQSNILVKCEATSMFTLKRFNELKNIKRKAGDKEGQLYKGDMFECSVDLAKYLDTNKVVKIIEVIPEKK